MEKQFADERDQAQPPRGEKDRALLARELSGEQLFQTREPARFQRARIVRQLCVETPFGRESENPIRRLGWMALGEHTGQKALRDAFLRRVEKVDLVQDEDNARNQLPHFVEIVRFRLRNWRIG